MRSLRLTGPLVALGYLVVVAGTVAWNVNFWRLNEIVVSQSAATVGYGLAGLACWRWIVACRDSNVDPRLVRVPSRLMAAASVAIAASFAAITVLYFRNHRLLTHLSQGLAIDPHYRLRMAGGAACVIGLVMAAVGFWMAASCTLTSTEPLDVVVPTS